MAGRLERVRAFLDDRTGYRRRLLDTLERPVEGGAHWMHVFGTALLLVIIIQVVTGLLMLVVYTPSVNSAWSSVFYLQHRVTLGWFVRGLHHYGAQAVMVVLGFHLLQTIALGAYKQPREVTWWIGLLLLALVQGMAVTGYLLPWDQKGYWASKVVTGIAGSLPLVGGAVQRALVGGSEYGQSTLSRLFALHVGVLPALVVFVLMMHLALVRRHGRTAPPGTNRLRSDPYSPSQLGRDAIAGLLLAGVLAALTVWTRGASLEAPADPGSSDFPPRPEWFFLFLFQTLKYLPAKLEILGTVVLPGIVGLLLFALPFLDRKPTHRVRDRIVWVVPVVLGFVGISILTFLAFRDDANDKAFVRARREADYRAQRSVELAMVGIPPAGPLEMLRQDPMVHGRDIYRRLCLSCHVLDGDGKRKAPDHTGFASREWIDALLRDPQAPHFFGRAGLEEDMPSQSKLGDEALRAVTELLYSMGRERKDADVDRALVEAGRRVMQNKCMRCHVFEGDGDFMGAGGPNLTGWGSRTWISGQIAHPSADTQYGELNKMPDFADQLTDHDLAMITAFLRRQRFERFDL